MGRWREDLRASRASQATELYFYEELSYAKAAAACNALPATLRWSMLKSRVDQPQSATEAV